MDAGSAIVEVHAEIERRFEAHTWAGVPHDNRAGAVERLADEPGRCARLETGLLYPRMGEALNLPVGRARRVADEIARELEQHHLMGCSHE